VDTLIIIPNQNLFRLANERTTFTEAFAMADDVLYQGVKGVTDLMVRPGLINLDFADVRAVMDEMGKAMMGTGEASGEDRAVQAAEKAIANPLLDEISLNGARGVLINITGGYDLTLFELDEAANIIREKVDPDANIIVGSTLDTAMEGSIRVSVVATGIDASQNKAETPNPRRTMAEPLRPAAAAPAPVAEPAPPAYAPAAYAPAPQQPPMMQPSPSLFDAPAAAPASDYDDEGDLPPPAYQPRPAAQQPQSRMATPSVSDDPAGFVAPRPPVSGTPAPGTPSPDALRRLQQAVSKQPAVPTQRPAAAAAPRPGGPAAKPAEAPRPRFGIGSLINRMAGGQGDAGAAAAAARQQPPMTSYDDEPDMNAEQERIEIPAFLRRQAN
ncbi:MAG: hypothetical protein RIT14_365, partial [Pseudomonadota bacterium]